MTTARQLACTSDTSLFSKEARERLEAVLHEAAQKFAHERDEMSLNELMAIISGRALYLAGNLVEFAGFEREEAERSAWQVAWGGLAAVMGEELEDPTLEVATGIDRASSRLFPCTYDSEGKPQDIALAMFYRQFADRIDTPSIHTTAVWLHE